MNQIYRQIEGDWITIVFLLVLLLFILVKNRTKESIWLQIQQLLFASQHPGHDKIILDGKHLLILLANGFTFSLVLSFFLKNYFSTNNIDSQFVCFAKAIGFVTLYYLFRSFVLWALAQLFEISKALTYFIDTSVSVLFYFTILLFATGLAHQYMAEASHHYFLIGGTVFAGVCYVFLKSKSLLNLKKILGFRKMHFILYLCTLEITPLLLVGRFMYLTM